MIKRINIISFALLFLFVSLVPKWKIIYCNVLSDVNLKNKYNINEIQYSYDNQKENTKSVVKIPWGINKYETKKITSLWDWSFLGEEKYLLNGLFIDENSKIENLIINRTCFYNKNGELYSIKEIRYIKSNQLKYPDNLIGFFKEYEHMVSKQYGLEFINNEISWIDELGVLHSEVVDNYDMEDICKVMNIEYESDYFKPNDLILKNNLSLKSACKWGATTIELVLERENEEYGIIEFLITNSLLK